MDPASLQQLIEDAANAAADAVVARLDLPAGANVTRGARLLTVKQAMRYLSTSRSIA